MFERIRPFFKQYNRVSLFDDQTAAYRREQLNAGQSVGAAGMTTGTFLTGWNYKSHTGKSILRSI